MSSRKRKWNSWSCSSADCLKFWSAPSSRGSEKLYFSTKQAILPTDVVTLHGEEQNLFGDFLKVSRFELTFFDGLESRQIGFSIDFLNVQLTDGDLEDSVDGFGDGLCFRIVAFAEESFYGVHLALERLGANCELVVHAQTLHGTVQRCLVACNSVTFVNERVHSVNNNWKTKSRNDFLYGIGNEARQRWNSGPRSPQDQNGGSAAVDYVLGGRDYLVAQNFRVQTYVVAYFHVAVIVVQVEGEAFC